MSKFSFINFLLLMYGVSLGCWAISDKPEPIILPKQTPMTAHQLDKNNVVVAHLPDGNKAYNVFEVAMQAMQGRDAFSIYLDKKSFANGLLPRSANPTGFGDPYQISAYHWLETNAVEINDALIWYYKFDNAYNDIQISNPWGSAFGQAHVIKAFLYAWNKTGEAKYREYCIKAAKAFSLTLSEGGFKSNLSDGSTFFEEVPVEPAAHILNGHMISTITLLELGQALNIDWITDLGQQGVDTLKKHLSDYDLGYWSRYDMNPKKGEIIFRLSPSKEYVDSPILLDRVVMENSLTGENTDLDIGSPDDAKGAWRVSGVEWTQIQIAEGKTVRGVTYGPAQHCGPLTGGSIQNTYLIFQLPTLTYDELSEVPLFYLRINYIDYSPGTVNIEIQDISHGNFMGFRTLSQGAIHGSGDGKWKTAYIPIQPKDLAWFMGPDYQKYHVDLLKQLFTLTKDNEFKVFADRWESYLVMHSEENVENFMSVKKGCN